MVEVWREGTDSDLVTTARVATGMWSRFWGLLGRRSLASNEGLLIDPCNSVHTAFMQFPIDVLFLDGDDCVLKIANDLKPFRMAVGRGARKVLETAAGRATSAGVRVGDQLTFKDHL